MLHKYCTLQRFKCTTKYQYCTTLHNMYNIVHKFCFQTIFRLYNFSSCLLCTMFCTILYSICSIFYIIVQVVKVVHSFVQYCNGLVCRWAWDRFPILWWDSDELSWDIPSEVLVPCAPSISASGLVTPLQSHIPI